MILVKVIIAYRPVKYTQRDGGGQMAVYDFGIRLKELREAKHLSQKEVAGRLDVTRATISGYERNTITPSVDQLVKLAVLYNTSLDYMMGMENRTHLYLDDLSKTQQKTVLDIVERLKEEFLGSDEYPRGAVQK